MWSRRYQNSAVLLLAGILLAGYAGRINQAATVLSVSGARVDNPTGLTGQRQSLEGVDGGVSRSGRTAPFGTEQVHAPAPGSEPISGLMYLLGFSLIGFALVARRRRPGPPLP